MCQIDASNNHPNLNIATTRLPEKELVVTSGAYSYGLVTAAKELSSMFSSSIDPTIPLRSSLAGEYTVVASAFEPHHMGSFSLKVDSSYPFDLKPIPQEGAGMYSKVVRGLW